jgi:hypothetical protein
LRGNAEKIHEAVLAEVDSLDGLRVRRDMIAEHQRELECKGGCPIVALGSELAEIDPRARADVAAQPDHLRSLDTILSYVATLTNQ